jgi:o-succinylbenzoate synthase
MNHNTATIKIKNVSLSAFQREFQGRVASVNSTLTDRSGIIISAESSSGKIGYGEISPLEGLHTEKLEQLVDPLAALLANLSGLEIEANTDDVFKLGSYLRKDQKLPPSLVFGVEALAADLAAKECGLPLSSWLSSTARSEIKVNGLAVPGHTSQGAYDIWKIKVVGAGVEQKLSSLRKTISSLPAGSKFRLDFGGRAEEAEILTLLKALKNEDIDYLEDPSTDLELLRRIKDDFGVSIALDQCAVEQDSFECYLQAGVFETLVIKPALYGGLSAVFERASLCAEAGLKVAVSSCFESEVGLAASLQLAAALPAELSHCGLATLELFRGEQPQELLPVDGKLIVPEKPGLGVEPNLAVSDSSEGT